MSILFFNFYKSVLETIIKGFWFRVSEGFSPSSWLEGQYVGTLFMAERVWWGCVMDQKSEIGMWPTCLDELQRLTVHCLLLSALSNMLKIPKHFKLHHNFRTCVQNMNLLWDDSDANPSNAKYKWIWYQVFTTSQKDQNQIQHIK